VRPVRDLCTSAALLAWLAEHGDPIRYRCVSARWPLPAYRTPYADTPGSAEMPSTPGAHAQGAAPPGRAGGTGGVYLILPRGSGIQEAASSPSPQLSGAPVMMAPW
jgi:S-adenosylmethionine:tRNA ribosyltransferase-isomerase